MVGSSPSVYVEKAHLLPPMRLSMSLMDGDGSNSVKDQRPTKKLCKLLESCDPTTHSIGYR